jgi:uncharacterized membrane protein/protein-disulfide isomerase
VPPSPSPSAGSTTTPAADRSPRRGLPLALLVLALTGLVVAIDLWVIHARAHAGDGSSFCNFSERVSCDKVALSGYSALLGVPLAAWGALAYLAMAGLAGSALRRRAGATWPAGLSTLLAGLMSALALVLAYLSEVVIQSLCVMCLASWLVSFALLGVSIAMARRAGGLGPALRADVASVRARPFFPTAGAGLLAVAAVALLAFHGRAVPPPAPAPGPATLGAPGSVVVYEYSDYLCPSCAQKHALLRTLLPSRPDVRMVRRFYPLDGTCNRAVPSEFHKGACALALAGVCAERQGRFEAYDDAAFANQQAKLPLEDVARQAGLDLPALAVCMGDPASMARVKADVEDGIRAGVDATPSFQHEGKLYKGSLPPILDGAVASGARR